MSSCMLCVTRVRQTININKYRGCQGEKQSRENVSDNGKDKGNFTISCHLCRIPREIFAACLLLFFFFFKLMLNWYGLYGGTWLITGFPLVLRHKIGLVNMDLQKQLGVLSGTVLVWHPWGSAATQPKGETGQKMKSSTMRHSWDMNHFVIKKSYGILW